jgi:hypothetical protein
MGILINTRSFGERLSDTTTHGALILSGNTDHIYELVQEYLLKHTSIGKFARENNQKVVFNWKQFEGRIWLFDNDADIFEFENAPDYAREIIFDPAFYVYLPSTIIVQEEG